MAPVGGRRVSNGPGLWPSGCCSPDRDDPAEATLSRERQEALVRGLARLSAPHRQVVTCRYLLDLDEAESAAVLGWPRGTVKSRLHRALARLRDVLDDDAERVQAREEAHDG